MDTMVPTYYLTIQQMAEHSALSTHIPSARS